MHRWEPATEAEAAMRDALAVSDQDRYFRILSRSDLLLPVSADSLRGRAPMGWGTWTTGNRTHVLAFTSPAALRLCLNEPTGSFRAVPFATLAAEWPNYEWWLAINPGLPIEAYLPSWFITQLVRGAGEVRMPGRTTAGVRARMAQSDLAAAISGRIRATGPGRSNAAPRPAAAPPSPASPSPYGSSPTGGAPHQTYGSQPPFPPQQPVGPSAPGRPHQGFAPQQPSPPQQPSSPPQQPSSPPQPAATSPSTDLAPYRGFDAFDEYAARRGYGYRDGYAPADGYSPRDGYASPGGYAAPDGYPRPDGYRRPDGYGRHEGYGHQDGYGRSDGYPADGYAPPGGYAPRDGYSPPDGYASPDGYVEPPSPTRVTAHVGTEPVETVEAEIVDSGPEPAASGPSSPADGRSDDEHTTRFAQRDFGARLSEQQSYTETPSVRAEPPPQPAPAQPSSWTPRRGMIEDAEIVPPTEAWAVGFVPANETEAELLAAAETNNTDAFLSTLLLARVILPVPISMPPGSRPRDKYFPWQIEEVDDERLIAVFTSTERFADYGPDRFGPDMSTMSMRFIELIEAWPSPKIQFSINPGTPVGITLPGSQIVALASWAAEVGLRGDNSGEVVVSARKQEASLGVAGAPTVGAGTAVLMQRTVPPAQLPFYLERGYDRVSGFVNRASEVAHLTTPRTLYRALGLVYEGSPFAEGDTEVHVLRWVAHRPDLYRLPYGGQTEAAMRAMQGWVIERAPFRGNGFAPGDTDVVAEFKVDSVRLPHGAQIWRLTQDGEQTLVASFDADAGRWVRAPESGADEK